MTVIGLDVGGTTMKGGVVSADGPAHRTRVGTPRADGPEAVVDAVLATIAGRLAAAGGLEVDAIGLAVPGIVDEEAGIARWSANLRWQGVRLRDRVADRVGVPVVLGHDVRAAALAEATMGAGRGHGNVVFLSLGTGLSAAQVVDGEVMPGATWRAGEIGQLPIAGQGGDRAPLEGIASAQALADRYERDKGLRPGSAGANEVVGAATRGDALAQGVLDDALRRLAEVLAVVISFADPSVVIVGGGLSLAGDALLEPLTTRVTAAVSWREPPPLLAARLGDEAGWAGAALLAWRHVGHPDGRFPWGAWQVWVDRP